MLRKCCAHCPGSVTRTGEPIREHACAIPTYVSGNLQNLSRISCDKHSCKMKKDGDKKKDETSLVIEPINSCYERFATAKKFHAENLQHQPLPDRVDDAIFTVDKHADDPCVCDNVKRCQKIVPRRQAHLRKKELNRMNKYTPTLGCKKPITYMDLAICWETPVDASYEPRRPVHIDGSDGGPAPAIFTLVKHSASQTDVRDGCIPGQEDRDDRCCEHGHSCEKFAQTVNAEEDREDLCKNLDSMCISSERQRDTDQPIGAAARNKRAQFMRHCESCGKKKTSVNNRQQSPRKSNVRAVRSASCLQKNGCTVVQRKNNGLPGKCHVPRPRTPYARRSFCIDTLAPPFSIVNGCRDADYPEHWRLTSIYQQSYRNPRKMREGRTLLNYDREVMRR